MTLSEIQACVAFLNRATLQGSEVAAFNQVLAALKREADDAAAREATNLSSPQASPP